MANCDTNLPSISPPTTQTAINLPPTSQSIESPAEITNPYSTKKRGPRKPAELSLNQKQDGTTPDFGYPPT